jgi:hypothetical protein
MHLTVQHPAPSSSPSASTDLLLSTHYPLHEHQSVLFLSPDAELSPWFAHWLTFTTLNYRYGTYSAFDTAGLAGISLTPPENNPGDSVPLLSARPSGNALYFAEHWAEFHSYASLKLHAPASVNLAPHNGAIAKSEVANGDDAGVLTKREVVAEDVIGAGAATKAEPVAKVEAVAQNAAAANADSAAAAAAKVEPAAKPAAAMINKNKPAPVPAAAAAAAVEPAAVPAAKPKSQSKATAITLASASAPWTSHWLEISRARGWQMLYPTFADGLAKVHTEVPSVAGSAGRAKAKESTEGGLMELKYWLQTLPDSDLPDWRKLPRVDQDGRKTSLEEWEEKTEEWRRGLSRCPERTEEEEMEAQKRREGWGELGGLGDLFCDTEGNGVEF